ncbi:MAG: hypothetical protein H6698_04805 [Myxococcales bacterium]|nr:hypothetical protein [Myxococcales bacterium]MCB9533621.1 hypothetical protein [Myxococcales bacterium]
MRHRLLALTLATLAVGCGDDESDTTPDAGADAAADASSDASADASTDAVADTEPDVAVDVAPDVAADTEPTGPTLAELSERIFVPTCGGLLCHLNGSDGGGLSLDFDDTLQARLLGPSSVDGIPLVTPGSPDDSYLYLKLTDAYVAVGGEGEQMPFGSRPLGTTGLQLVADWINSLE